MNNLVVKDDFLIVEWFHCFRKLQNHVSIELNQTFEFLHVFGSCVLLGLSNGDYFRVCRFFCVNLLVFIQNVIVVVLFVFSGFQAMLAFANFLLERAFPSWVFLHDVCYFLIKKGRKAAFTIRFPTIKLMISINLRPLLYWQEVGFICV